jgi:hypothetical protein
VMLRKLPRALETDLHGRKILDSGWPRKEV